MTKRIALLIAGAASIAALSPASAQSNADEQRFQTAQARFDREVATYRAEVDRYRSSVRSYRGSYRGSTGSYNNNNGSNTAYDERDDPNYDASRYYRDGNYQERSLSADDRVYRGTDGRYYCKRNDGTTGLIVGAVGGGVLGNIIDGGHSRAVGTILGALGGGLAGRAIDRGNSNGSNNSDIRCR